MAEKFYYLFLSLRPLQWTKNLVLFTGLVFSGWFFIPQKFFLVLQATLIFSFLASAIYLLNDLCDIKKDQLHPIKKQRPIASGKISLPLALFFSLTLIFVTLFLAANLSFFFFLICLAYFFLHLFYNIFLKNIPILDVLTLASGFILRVYAGAVVINAHINIWLLLCVISFSLFLAVGKRRSELTLLKRKKVEGETRKVLFSYPEKLLDLYLSMFANSTWLTYSLFTFLYPSPSLPQKVITIWADIPQTFRNQKWLMATVPLVIYGVMRYLHLVYQKNEGESPAEVLILDFPLLVTILLWGIMIIFIIYGLG